MITPQKIQDLADPIESVYIHMVNELMVNIGRHITAPTWTHTAAWEIQKLSELGQLTQENAAIINAWIKQMPQEIRDTMEATRAAALDRLEKQLEQAAQDGYITPPARDSTLQVLEEYAMQAADHLNLVNTTMLRSSVDQYTRAVALTQQEYDKLMAQQEATQTILNEAAGNVATAAETRLVAMRRAIKRISDEGLTGFIDRAGRSWTPEAYVNMDIRTTVHNVAIQATKNRMEDYGTQVFQVSSHAGARPGCYPYQGKFYSWDNTAGSIPLGNGTVVDYEPLNSTTYGQPAGLFGINCGHYPIPVIPGVTIPHGADNIQPEAENDKAYAESQEQRALERKIREAKRVVEMAGEAATKEDKAKIRELQKQMREFTERTGRTRRYDRESIGGTRQTARTPTTPERPNVQPAALTVQPITLPPFTPATTREDAEQYAKDMGFAFSATFSGLSLDQMNDVNRQLLALTTKYPINPLAEIKGNSRIKAVAQANFHSLEVNGKKIGSRDTSTWEANRAWYRASIQDLERRFPEGKIPRDIQKKIDNLQKKLQYTRWGVSVTHGTAATISHEYGHIISDQYFGMINHGHANSAYNDPTKRQEMARLENLVNDTFERAKRDGDIYKISQYGATDADEFFAETFAMREMGETLPDYITQMLEETTRGPVL
jgi:hypothetical protein